MTTIPKLLKKYDCFLIDIWGVITDGVEPYHDALELLNILKEHKKYIVLMSNTPTLSDDLATALTKIGISPDEYHTLVTAGDVTRHYLLNMGYDNPYYFHIGKTKHPILANTPFIESATLEDAQFILMTDIAHEDMSPIFKLALEKQLPVVCANPDVAVYRKNGEKLLCAGHLARDFEAQNGRIIYFGKPYPEIFKYCFTIIPSFKREKIVMIGDNLETDIQGAKCQGITSVLINRNQLAYSEGEHHPDFVIQSLSAIA